MRPTQLNQHTSASHIEKQRHSRTLYKSQTTHQPHPTHPPAAARPHPTNSRTRTPGPNSPTTTTSTHVRPQQDRAPRRIASEPQQGARPPDPTDIRNRTPTETKSLKDGYILSAQSTHQTKFSVHTHPSRNHHQPSASGGLGWLTTPSDGSGLLRKEVIQPHLPVRLPCYDFVLIASPTFDHSPRSKTGWAAGFGCCQLS